MKLTPLNPTGDDNQLTAPRGSTDEPASETEDERNDLLHLLLLLT